MHQIIEVAPQHLFQSLYHSLREEEVYPSVSIRNVFFNMNTKKQHKPTPQ